MTESLGYKKFMAVGFWSGGGVVDELTFYAYAYPEPQGFKEYSFQLSEAFMRRG
jgi:Family of unknown function (DUF5996)